VLVGVGGGFEWRAGQLRLGEGGPVFGWCGREDMYGVVGRNVMGLEGVVGMGVDRSLVDFELRAGVMVLWADLGAAGEIGGACDPGVRSVEQGVAVGERDGRTPGDVGVEGPVVGCGVGGWSGRAIVRVCSAVRNGVWLWSEGAERALGRVDAVEGGAW